MNAEDANDADEGSDRVTLAWCAFVLLRYLVFFFALFALWVGTSLYQGGTNALQSVQFLDDALGFATLAFGCSLIFTVFQIVRRAVFGGPSHADE